MAIKLPPRSYLTFTELQARWQCSENDLTDLVVSCTLRPSIQPSGPLRIPEWGVNEQSGNISPVGYAIVQTRTRDSYEEDGEETFTRQPSGRIYLQSPQNIGLLDCEFGLANDERDPIVPDHDGIDWHGGWYCLPSAMNMADVKNQGMFEIGEVLSFEALNGGDQHVGKVDSKLSDKERGTLLRIIGILCKEARLDITKHAKTAGLIANMAASMGVAIAETTVENHIKGVPAALADRMK